MKKLLLLLIVSRFLAAGILAPSCSVSTVVAPGVLNCTASWAGGSLSSIIGGTLTTSRPTGPVTISVAGAAVTANKTASTNRNSFVIWGFNNAPIPDGIVIT